MSKRVLVLAPMPTELAPVVKRLGLVRGPDRIARGTVRDHEVVACLGGIGTKAARAIATRMIEQERPDHVVVCGIAGGLGPDVQIGDLVIPETATDVDTGEIATPTPLGAEVPAGRMVTSGELITDRSILVGYADDGILAIDMETAGIGAVATQHDLPWIAYRGISDHIRDDLVDEHTIGLMQADGTPNLGNVARYIGRDPRRIGRLARLAKGTKAATKVATAALASALADPA